MWVSWLVAGDTHYAATRHWLSPYLRAGGEIAGPTLLLAEVAGPVVRRTGRPTRALRALKDLRSLTLLHLAPVDDSLALAAAQLAIDLRLRGADAVYVAMAQRLGVPLITWDEEQQSRAAVAIAVYTPANAPRLA